MTLKKMMALFICFCVWAFIRPYSAIPQDQTGNKPVALKLGTAVMCEKIIDHKPVNRTVLFSASHKKAICYTDFESVPETMYIYHVWFRRDKQVTKIRLAINPPQWSTYSDINIRESDKGPWRVDITDADGNVIRILRFSITE